MHTTSLFMPIPFFHSFCHTNKTKNHKHIVIHQTIHISLYNHPPLYTPPPTILVTSPRKTTPRLTLYSTAFISFRFLKSLFTFLAPPLSFLFNHMVFTTSYATSALHCELPPYTHIHTHTSSCIQTFYHQTKFQELSSIQTPNINTEIFFLKTTTIHLFTIPLLPYS